MPQVTEVVRIRRKVFSELARMAFENNLLEDVDSIPENISREDSVRYRCCVHKERAILGQRINLALHQPIGMSLRESALNALHGEKADIPAIQILPEACDKCPIDRMIVTDACRNCVAHSCIGSCAKRAIVIVQNKAYIDSEKCVECGQCQKACSYGAIIEIIRPCERACALGAIHAGEDRRAVIDREHCVLCGACVTACPFGAVSDTSDIVQFIQALHSETHVYALLAPSFVGQFGVRYTAGHIAAALKQLGFYALWEASSGADIVVLEDAKEYVASVPAKQPAMMTSCCPSFVQLIEKHVPELAAQISSVISPMLAAARWIKQSDPKAIVVFIGPCFAKKEEARREARSVDFVLTFEELSAILEAKALSLATIQPETCYLTKASHDGNAFACAGGVAEAVSNALKEINPARHEEVRLMHCEGLAECLKELQAIRDGKSSTTLLEGMACTGGCVGGPGTLINQRVGHVQVERYSATAMNQHAHNNLDAVAQTSHNDSSWHTHPDL